MSDLHFFLDAIGPSSSASSLHVGEKLARKQSVTTELEWSYFKSYENLLRTPGN